MWQRASLNHQLHCAIASSNLVVVGQRLLVSSNDTGNQSIGDRQCHETVNAAAMPPLVGTLSKTSWSSSHHGEKWVMG